MTVNLSQHIYIAAIPKFLASALIAALLLLGATPAFAQDGSPSFTLEMLQSIIAQEETVAAPVEETSEEVVIEVEKAVEVEVPVGQPSISTVETSDESETEPVELLQRLSTTRKPTPPLPYTQPTIGPALPDLTVEEFPTTVERWIRVDLGTQRVIAYDGINPVKEFVISSGKAETPTVVGTFRIQHKVPQQTMQGGVPGTDDYYNLPGVKWVQYFYGDYGFHTAYWHNDFGTPVSHGCINMVEEDAKWLFDWAGPYWDGASPWYSSSNDNPGTLVMVHE